WEIARKELADIIVGHRNMSDAAARSASGAMPGRLSLVSPLISYPSSQVIEQPVTATFTVQNTGGQTISVQYFFAGARDASNGRVDFPVSAAVTLQPGQRFTYHGSRTFATSGIYSAWPEYYDGTNWVEVTPSHTTFHVGGSSPTTNRFEESNAVKNLAAGLSKYPT